ncbi:hypothetical protein SOM70_36780 [Streptomyces salinarius]|uniref:hypothetical protein n=1 Tax=Streptomyces salinarius TaxID=2762598 RepID=UPI0032DFD4CB
MLVVRARALVWKLVKLSGEEFVKGFANKAGGITALALGVLVVAAGRGPCRCHTSSARHVTAVVPGAPTGDGSGHGSNTRTYTPLSGSMAYIYDLF